MRSVIASTRFAVLATLAALAPSLAQGRPEPPIKLNPDHLSAGARAWYLGPDLPEPLPGPDRSTVRFGTNVDANNPQLDFAGGQSETAIAAVGERVLVAWNDATGFLPHPPTRPRSSLTGLAFSPNGARNFRDLLGLPNDDLNQRWFGDPTIVAVNGGDAFIVGGLYLPDFFFDCSRGPARLTLAVAVVTVNSVSDITITNPIVAVDGGDVCNIPPFPDFPDRLWLGYDDVSRTLVMSYTRFVSPVRGFTTGQIEIVRAHVPANPANLTSGDFGAPIVVWPEERFVVNQGSFVTVVPGGDAYLGWERNFISNLSNGRPLVYPQAARVKAGERSPDPGGPTDRRVLTLGQVNSNAQGGVKSLDGQIIPGYSRGFGPDWPRVAYDATRDLLIYVWNDASLHPLGDIWMRALPRNLALNRPIKKVNDDDSFALHFLPAVSVRSDGSIATSWHDRRLGGPDSAKTDYFGEIRPGPSVPAADFRISTGSTDWTNTASLINPNFGDYTDNASTGTTTYFTWADGRIGVPQPFVDSRR